MAKSNPGFEKRAREQKKRLKQIEKAKRKVEREEAKRLGLPIPGTSVENADEPAEGSEGAAPSAGAETAETADAPPPAGDEAPGGPSERSD